MNINEQLQNYEKKNCKEKFLKNFILLIFFSTTDQSLEPLRAALLDFDDQIGDMKNRIIFMKKKINHNEKANAARLLDIIRQTK